MPLTMLNTSLLILVPFVFVALRRLFRYGNAHGAPYPPGPKKKFLVGNLLDLPTGQPWLTYTKLAKVHGDLISMQALGQNIVVINSEKVAIDLLEKRSHIYSSRPYFTMLDMMGWGFHLSSLPFSDQWKLYRRIFQQYFRPEASQKYLSIQTNKTHQLLRQIVDTPEHFTGHIKTLSASIIMDLVYGIKITSENDPYIEVAEKAISMGANSMFPGAVLCNLLPFLRCIPTWFPGAGFKRYAAECEKLVKQMLDKPIEFVERHMADGHKTSCMASHVLENHSLLGNVSDPEATMKGVLASAYAAGVDTTHGVISSAILAMVLNPSVQQIAQAEIDRVVGRERLPDWNDRESLPYVGALCREVLRWAPVFPLGLPRATTENDIYEGMFIPKGSMVWPNIWAMTRNEAIFPDPEKFRPERFLSQDGSLNDHNPSVVFGFGRRICPGRHMAVNSVWIAVVSVLHTFNCSKAIDAQGNEISVEPLFGSGVLSHPLPFKCDITPRSDAARRLILDTA